MGPDKFDGDLYIMGADGISLPLVKLETFSDIGEEGQKLGIKIGATYTYKFELKNPRDLRCKTSKRFVKLLMSRGVERNKAVEAARKVRRYGSYQKCWLFIRLGV